MWEPEMDAVRVPDDPVVADFMTIEPVTIAPEARIEDAQLLLELYDISGLPVVDAQGTLRGVISQTDLLRGSGDVESAVRRRFTGLRVADLMTSPAITVELETPLVEAARLMRDEKVHRLVAVNEGGRAVGVLSSMDFVSLYADR
jgi:CBS domain-containing protein